MTSIRNTALSNTMLYRMLDHQEAEQAKKDAQAFAANQALTGAVERAGNQAVGQERFEDQQEQQVAGREQQAQQFEEQRQDTAQSRAQAAAAQLLQGRRQDEKFSYEKTQDKAAMDFRQQQLQAQEAQNQEQTAIAWYNAKTLRERAEASAANAEAKLTNKKPNPVVEKEIREAEDSLATIVSIERDFAPEQIYEWQQFSTSKVKAPLANALSYVGADTLAAKAMDPNDQKARANWESRITSMVSPIISKNFGASRSGNDLKEAAMAFAQAQGNPVRYQEAFKNMKAALERHIMLRSKAMSGVNDIETVTPDDLDRKMNMLYDMTSGKSAPTSAAGAPQSQPGANKEQQIQARYLELKKSMSPKEARQHALAQFGEADE